MPESHSRQPDMAVERDSRVTARPGKSSHVSNPLQRPTSSFPSPSPSPVAKPTYTTASRTNMHRNQYAPVETGIQPTQSRRTLHITTTQTTTVHMTNSAVARNGRAPEAGEKDTYRRVSRHDSRACSPSGDAGHRTEEKRRRSRVRGVFDRLSDLEAVQLCDGVVYPSRTL